MKWSCLATFKTKSENSSILHKSQSPDKIAGAGEEQDELGNKNVILPSRTLDRETLMKIIPEPSQDEASGPSDESNEDTSTSSVSSSGKVSLPLASTSIGEKLAKQASDHFLAATASAFQDSVNSLLPDLSGVRSAAAETLSLFQDKSVMSDAMMQAMRDSAKLDPPQVMLFRQFNEMAENSGLAESILQAGMGADSSLAAQLIAEQTLNQIPAGVTSLMNPIKSDPLIYEHSYPELKGPEPAPIGGRKVAELMVDKAIAEQIGNVLSEEFDLSYSPTLYLKPHPDEHGYWYIAQI